MTYYVLVPNIHQYAHCLGVHTSLSGAIIGAMALTSVPAIVGYSIWSDHAVCMYVCEGMVKDDHSTYHPSPHDAVQAASNLVVFLPLCGDIVGRGGAVFWLTRNGVGGEGAVWDGHVRSAQPAAVG